MSWHICSSAVESRRDLWSCRSASRNNKLSLMHKVACGSFTWCVGAWTVTQRQMVSMRAAVNRQAKGALNVHRVWGDTEESYHRRANKVLSQTMKACGLPDVDVYILKRMYDYTGHLARIVRDKPEHLTGKLLGYRDAEWKNALMQVVGHQGHKGRFSPWSWERQYDSFFRSKGHSWRDVARDRELWQSFRSQWMRHMLGSKAANSRFGVL